MVNLRRVRWTSFQPNFFVQMQPGVLDRAPKTFLGTLHHLSQEKKAQIQDQLVRKFPTVSILDVERTGKKILQVVGQMTWALQLWPPCPSLPAWLFFTVWSGKHAVRVGDKP